MTPGQNGLPQLRQEDIITVKQLVGSDRRLTVRMIADELGLNGESVRTILQHDLGMRKMCAKLLPKILPKDKKQRRVNFRKGMLGENK